jgi:hypothetical protein
MSFRHARGTRQTNKPLKLPAAGFDRADSLCLDSGVVRSRVAAASQITSYLSVETDLAEDTLVWPEFRGGRSYPVESVSSKNGFEVGAVDMNDDSDSLPFVRITWSSSGALFDRLL